MRAVTAKRLRRLVYGDSSLRTREYDIGKRTLPGTKTEIETGARINLGLRAKYQRTKEIYRMSKKNLSIDIFIYLQEVGNK